MKSILSPNISKGRKRKVQAIVIHTTESPEVPGSATNVAQNWFALKTSKVSAHYVQSAIETVQCVKESDTAWHAGKANGWTIGIELVGKAGQSSSDWCDPFSREMLGKAAMLVADICRRHDIEVRKLNPDELVQISEGSSLTGICGHADVSKGLGGTHTDPGRSFPWYEFLLTVQHYLNAKSV